MPGIYDYNLTPGSGSPSTYKALGRFALGIHVSSASVSLLALFYGLFIMRIRPDIWRIWMFQVLLIVQLLNFLRFIDRTLAAKLTLHHEVSCRVLLFLNYILALTPLYLCVYTVLYLQLVVIHKVPTSNRWPRLALLITCLVLPIVSSAIYVALPNRVLGIPTVCRLPIIPNSRQYWIMLVCTYMWLYIIGCIGLFSMLMLTIHIIRIIRKARNEVNDTEAMYGSRYIAERQQDNVMIGRILVSLVWFPLTPIATSWLITILVSVHYYKQKLYPVSEFASIGLLGLQSIFLAIALVVNPYVIDAFKHRHRCNKPELSLHQDVETLRTVSVSVLQIPTESSINSRKTSVPPDHTHDMPPDAV